VVLQDRDTDLRGVCGYGFDATSLSALPKPENAPCWRAVAPVRLLLIEPFRAGRDLGKTDIINQNWLHWRALGIYPLMGR